MNHSTLLSIVLISVSSSFHWIQVFPIQEYIYPRAYF